MARAMDENELIAYYEDLVLLDHSADDAVGRRRFMELQRQEIGAPAFDNERLINAVANALRVYGLEIGLVDTANGQAIKIVEL